MGFTRFFLVATFCMAVTLTAAEYSTYVGNSNPVSVSQLISDPAGNVYIAGSRTFNLYPAPLSEAIVMKLDTAGKTILSASLSGKGNDVANAVALDGQGNIYIAGQTSSPDFPLRHPLYSSPPSSPSASIGFITKFNPDASQILYSTYFPEAIAGMAVDGAGNAYITGTTSSALFPVTAGLPTAKFGASPIIYGAFLTKISAAGDHIAYSTVIAGYAKNCGCCSSCFLSPRNTRGVAVAVDAAGNAYIAGNTDVSDLPATPGAWLANGVGAFVAKVNTGGTALAYLTYLGSGAQVVSPYTSPATLVSALAVDGGGNVYVAGYTFDPAFPATPGAFQSTFHGWSTIDNFQSQPPTDAFALKLNPTGTAVSWASYLGGTGGDAATAAVLDSSGNLWIAGATRSTDFPNVQGWSTGGGFIVKFNASGSALPYSGRYPDGSIGQTLAVDSTGLLHVASPSGVVSSVAALPRPAVRPWVVVNAAGGTAGGQVAAGELVAIYGPHIGAFPALQNTNAAHVPSSLGGVQVFFNDIAAPLLYAGDAQINAVVPFEVAGQSTVRIRIVNQGVTGPEFEAAVVPAIPEVFRSASVAQAAAALNEDGTVNSADNPAAKGSIVTIWATGINPPAPAVPDGQVAPGGNDFHCCAVYGGYPLLATSMNVLYAGAAPGLVAGVVQVNFRVTVGGPLTLTTGGGSFSQLASDTFSIYVKP